MRVPQVAEENPIPKSYVDTTATAPSELAAPEESDFSRARWLTVKNPWSGVSSVACSNCGEDRRDSEEEEHEIVRRIVRPSNNYGNVSEGGEVWIEPRHMNGAEWSATMSPREWAAYQESLRAPKPKLAPTLVRMVQQSQAAHKAQVDELNKRGREQMMQSLAQHQRSVLKTQPASADAEIIPPKG